MYFKEMTSESWVAVGIITVLLGLGGSFSGGVGTTSPEEDREAALRLDLEAQRVELAWARGELESIPASTTAGDLRRHLKKRRDLDRAWAQELDDLERRLNGSAEEFQSELEGLDEELSRLLGAEPQLLHPILASARD